MKENKKKKIRDIFIGFFAAMLALTILSRAIDSVIIPKVQVQTYTPGNLSYQITGEGTVASAEQVYLDIPKGIKVDQVLQVGERVKEGQGILFLRLSDLEEKKKEALRETKKQELALEKELIGQGKDEGTTQTEEIVGDLALSEQNLKGLELNMQKEQEEYAKALEELKKNYKRDQEFEEQRRSISKEEIRQMNETLEEESKKSYAPAELAYDEAMARLKEDYETALKRLEEDYEQTMLEMNNKRDQFHQLLYQARLAAKKDENTVKNKQTDASLSQKTQEILKLDLEAQKEKLKLIEDLILVGGEVKSPWEGTITKMEIVPGTATSGAEIVEIGRGKFVLKGSVDKEQSNLLEIGDKIQVMLPLEAKPRTAAVTNIQRNSGVEKEQSHSYAKFIAELEDGDYQIGSSATYEIKKTMEMKYPCLIPLAAVREDGNGKFCLIAQKKKTILGEELIAERINLEWLNKDDSRAAVNLVFSDEDLIIVGSNKSIAEGDRVRIDE